MLQGTVTSFDENKGYGFIQADGDRTSYFCHYSGIKTAGYKVLTPNERVAFVLVEGKNGMQAVNITKLPQK